jgi:hypothetical protein
MFGCLAIERKAMEECLAREQKVITSSKPPPITAISRTKTLYFTHPQPIFKRLNLLQICYSPVGGGTCQPPSFSWYTSPGHD